MVFQILAILILAAFYGCYFAKTLFQRRRGIATWHPGGKKTGFVRSVQLALTITACLVPASELASILLNANAAPVWLRIAGVILGVSGTALFAAAAIEMKDNWRAGVSQSGQTGLVTGGIYGFSRNPAFLGFDLVYLGLLLVFFNWPLLILSALGGLMLHLQIVNVEEDDLLSAFGEDYLQYRRRVCRYFGRRRAWKHPAVQRLVHVSLGLGAVLAVLMVAFFWYVGDYYHAGSAALEALNGTDAVSVSRQRDGWLFDGPGDGDALIFYPGAKVDAAAYAPLLKDLAGEGVDCFLVEMPFRLAFFGMNKAADIMAAYDYERWYLAGHSLGGAMAAAYAAGHLEELDGLVMLAAYPTKSLDAEGFSVLSVYGSEDGVLNMDKVAEGRQHTPEDYTELCLDGGNHAQFGSYGEQAGDGPASITHEEQWEQTVGAVTDMIFDPVTQIRRAAKAARAVCAVAHVGYSELGAADEIRAGVAEEFSFLQDLPDEQVVPVPAGWDLYCIVPVDPAAGITVHVIEYDGEGGERLGPVAYSGSGPILLWCNFSDILPNALVTVTVGSEALEFSPFLSLRDGALTTTAPAGAIYDFTAEQR